MLRARPASPHRRTGRAVFLFAALALSACKGSETAGGGSSDIGGTIVFSTPSDAQTMLPPLIVNVIDRTVTDLLYDRLADISDDMNTTGDKTFKPQLAERWDWSADSLSIAFHINPRAKWHDGQPVRAADVRYSVQLYKDPALGTSATPLIANIDSASVRDSLTAVVHFKRHTPTQFYDMVYQVLILPQHVLASTPVSQMKTADIGRKGIGSGRFRLAKWEPGQRIELVADTANYRGRPKLDRVIWSIAPDFNAAVTRFMSGEADVFDQLRPEQIARLAGDTARRIVRYPTFQYTYLWFNEANPAALGQPHPLLGDRAVRRALTMAVDRRAMLRNVFDTLGQMLYGPFPNTVDVADSTLAQIPYDTVKARALLDSAGWIPGTDGVRSKNGRRLEFAITTPNSSAARKQYVVLLQEAFKLVGAAVRIDEGDFATFSAKQNDHKFDAIMALYATDPDVSGFKQTWSTAGMAKDGANFGDYSNPKVDALLDSATTTFDPSRKKDYARRAFEMIIQDAAGIWLYAPPTIAGVHKRIRTAPMRADGYWAHLADWYIPAGERSARDRIGLRPTQ